MASSQYVCSNCSSTFPKWMGKCTKCGEYNTIDEGVSASSGSAGLKGSKSATPMRPAQRAGDIKASPKDRLASGLTEFDRILNGGLTIGQVTLIAGEPGAGKSTLLIDLMHRFGEKGHTCLYVSGEESSEQIGLRAQRVGAVSTNLFVADETNLENVLGHIDQVSPDVVVIDSVQAVASPNIDSRAGGIAQVQEVAGTLTRLAKERGIRMILVGQITKSLEIS
jgi:DNA repair protein RadA/Sms